MVNTSASRRVGNGLKKDLTKVWTAGTAEGIAEVAVTARTICRFHLARSRRSALESELLLIGGRERGARHLLAHFLDFEFGQTACTALTGLLFAGSARLERGEVDWPAFRRWPFKVRRCEQRCRVDRRRCRSCNCPQGLFLRRRAPPRERKCDAGGNDRSKGSNSDGLGVERVGEDSERVLGSRRLRKV